VNQAVLISHKKQKRRAARGIIVSGLGEKKKPREAQINYETLFSPATL